MVTLAIAALHVSTLLLSLPREVHIFIFIFWRLSYNAGLGILLRLQSNSNFITRVYLALERRYPAKIQKLLEGSIGRDFRYADAPVSFRSWLLFRGLVNLILTHDALSYLLFCWRFLYIPPLSELGLLDFTQYLVGIGLIVFNWWAKADAHRVVGDYAWYWGDFFFRVEQELDFNGIYNLFPHPMYTVGYSVYYAASLMTQSYTVLFVSLCAHLCQLIFLAYIENPHIAKIYGSLVPQVHLQEHSQALFSDQGWFPRRSDLIIFKNFNPFRAVDFSLAALVLQACSMLLTDLPRGAYLGQALAWRVLHNVGLGYILWRQSRSSFWTERFLAQQVSKQEAFGHWKQIYNTSFTMNVVSFLLATVKFASIPSEISSAYIASLVCGGLLIALSIWTYTESAETLGEFGWFYGDFFIDDVRSTLTYSGIYRYFNNPDSVLGYAGLYGLAIIAQSWPLFLLAAFSQGLHGLFVKFVEVPHMRARYGNVRKDGNLSGAIKKSLSSQRLLAPSFALLDETADQLAEQAKKSAERVRHRAVRVKDKYVKEVQHSLHLASNLRDVAMTKVVAQAEGIKTRARKVAVIREAEELWREIESTQIRSPNTSAAVVVLARDSASGHSSHSSGGESDNSLGEEDWGTDTSSANDDAEGSPSKAEVETLPAEDALPVGEQASTSVAVAVEDSAASQPDETPAAAPAENPDAAP
eukprot:TRINITY_DN7860_c0_g1_i1.p1 TRINITY_DN7860_c0_g1~~TRINITY_DN7860_c0_g1_i1.p1  ORF type:complete len:759 (-),score=183.84 TRINITY_DN7860_c0_g1_i1:16-2109(-)